MALEPNALDTLPHPSAQAAGVPRSAPGRFQYAGGDHPLAGYTIKRGVGQGGFGEIYYATSDAGKDVALKLIRRNLEVELRGIRQCLNLKHPHLLDLYDIRQDDLGDTWVVMEYVSDPSLENVLATQPNGLLPQEALTWIHGIGQGVAYLHDHGIVHRDLKPGNIFRDEGVVKVGDYGLSKFISCSRRSGHTESIGTVHYMAPEVANGRYGKEIDVYALGVILYELLTGRVPFEGESIGEVLMKHLTAKPDVSMIAEPYRGIVARALEKDPSLRFASAAELLAALPAPEANPLLFTNGNREFAANSRELPTSGASADSFSSNAPAAKSPSNRSEGSLVKLKEMLLGPPRPRPLPVREKSISALVLKPPRERTAELLGSLLLSSFVAAAMCVVLMLVNAFLTDAERYFRPEQFAWLLLVGIAGAWAVLIPTKLWEGTRGDPLIRRCFLLIVGMGVGLFASALADWLMVGLPPAAGYPQPFAYKLPQNFYAVDGRPLLMAYVVCFGTLFFVVRWWLQAEPMRTRRLSLWKLFASVVLAGAAACAWQFPQPWLPMAAAVTSMSVQLSAPWRRRVKPWQW